MTEKFSIIVANYNNGRFLVELIESVLKQTFTNWELIIVDDASDDQSEEIVNSYLADKRIKFVKHKVNKGAGAAFNTAATLSSGFIIGMLGADDGLVPEALEKVYILHKNNPHVALITTRAYDCRDGLNPIGICEISGRQPEGVSLINEIHICNFVTFKTSYFKKTKGFSDEFKRGVDIDLYLKMEESGGGLMFLDEPVYLYRRHNGGISQGSNGTRAYVYSLKAHIEAYLRREKNGFKPNISKKEFQVKRFQYYQRSAFFNRIDGKNIESLFNLFSLVRYNPKYVLSLSFFTTIFYNIYSIIIKNIKIREKLNKNILL